MDEEPGEVAVTADPWPHALSGLRHSDQLRAILAGMPRPARARDVDWAQRAEMVRTRAGVDVLEPPPPALEVGGFPIEPIEPITRAVMDQGAVGGAEAAAEVVGEVADVVEVPEVVEVPPPPAVAFEPLRYEPVAAPVVVPAPPQPILWVPSSAFEGTSPVGVPAPPSAPSHAAPPMVPVAVTTPRVDPRFVAVSATDFTAPGIGMPTTAWTMRLGFGDPQPVPNPTAPAAAMNFSHRRSRWRRAVAVIVLVVVLAAAAVAGWMVWRHRNAAHPAPVAMALVRSGPATPAISPAS